MLRNGTAALTQGLPRLFEFFGPTSLAGRHHRLHDKLVCSLASVDTSQKYVCEQAVIGTVRVLRFLSEKFLG